MSSPLARTKFVVDEPRSSLSSQGFSQGFVLSQFWVFAGSGVANDTYMAAAGLDNSASFTVRLYHDLEPNYHGSQGQGYGADGYVTLLGFWTDGTFAAAPPPATRRIEWVGDSLTAGFGSRGVVPPCQANQYTASAYFSYSREVRGVGSRGGGGLDGAQRDVRGGPARLQVRRSTRSRVTHWTRC